jgi:hypothetical protein
MVALGQLTRPGDINRLAFPEIRAQALARAGK